MKRELYSSLLLLIVLFFYNELTVVIGRFVLGTGLICETLVTEYPLYCCIGEKGGLGDVLLTEQTVELTQCSPVSGNRLSAYALSSFSWSLILALKEWFVSIAFHRLCVI